MATSWVPCCLTAKREDARFCAWSSPLPRNAAEISRRDFSRLADRTKIDEADEGIAR